MFKKLINLNTFEDVSNTDVGQFSCVHCEKLLNLRKYLRVHKKEMYKGQRYDCYKWRNIFDRSFKDASHTGQRR